MRVDHEGIVDAWFVWLKHESCRCPTSCQTKKKFFAVAPAGGPKEVAKEATPPAPECAQGVKAQGL